VALAVIQGGADPQNVYAVSGGLRALEEAGFEIERAKRTWRAWLNAATESDDCAGRVGLKT